MRGISLPVENRLVSQEGLCSLEKVSINLFTTMDKLTKLVMCVNCLMQISVFLIPAGISHLKIIGERPSITRS